tara:strand:+ start:331 stop:579 length:249 start_codon:yes stop_codon:yes gene_type:complete
MNMTDKKLPTWDSLSDKEKKEFGSERNYGAFLRSLRSGQYDKKEEESMGIKPVKKKKSGINIKNGGLVLKVLKKGVVRGSYS